jgi:hypothetical protein
MVEGSVPMNKRFNQSRPIKRNRKSKAEIETIKEVLFEILYQDNPQTVRGVFYQAVSHNLIEKTEKEYKGTIVRLLGEMREDGIIPFSWIVDNSRWQHKPTTYSNLKSMMESSHKMYRRSIWDQLPMRVEIWIEKQALIDLFYSVTEKWDVPLYPAVGYASKTFVHEAAVEIDGIGKPTFIYFFGDYDPSGIDITRATEEKLKRYVKNTPIFCRRVAVTPQQIVQYNLPTRPTKKTDSRSKNFKGDSVELDAMPAKVLRALTNEIIEVHIDKDVVDSVLKAELAEKETLRKLIVSENL